MMSSWYFGWSWSLGTWKNCNMHQLFSLTYFLQMNTWKIICFNCGETFEGMIYHRSYAHNLSSCEIKAWKKFRPEWDSNSWPLKYRCSAVPTKLSSHLRASHVIHLPPVYYELIMWPTFSWLDTCTSVGKALHRYHRGHGFKSRSRPEFSLA